MNSTQINETVQELLKEDLTLELGGCAKNDDRGRDGKDGKDGKDADDNSVKADLEFMVDEIQI